MYALDKSLYVFGTSALRAAVPVEETSLQYFGGFGCVTSRVGLQ